MVPLWSPRCPLWSPSLAKYLSLQTWIISSKHAKYPTKMLDSSSQRCPNQSTLTPHLLPRPPLSRLAHLSSSQPSRPPSSTPTYSPLRLPVLSHSNPKHHSLRAEASLPPAPSAQSPRPRRKYRPGRYGITTSTMMCVCGPVFPLPDLSLSS